jgi:hypothetical protein
LPLPAAASAARSSVKPVVLNRPTVRPASLGRTGMRGSSCTTRRASPSGSASNSACRTPGPTDGTPGTSGRCYRASSRLVVPSRPSAGMYGMTPFTNACAGTFSGRCRASARHRSLPREAPGVYRKGDVVPRSAIACPVSVCPSSVPVGRGCLRQHRSQELLEARFIGEVDSWRLSTELRTRMCGRSSMVASQSLLDQCLRQPGLLPEPADPFREQVHPGGGVRLAPVSDQSAEERCPGR